MTFRATIHRVEAGRLLEWRAHDRKAAHGSRLGKRRPQRVCTEQTAI